MTFKIDWEKTEAHHDLPFPLLKKMVSLAYPNRVLRDYEIISGGCANLNIKIYLDNELFPLILRIYLREPNAAYREQQLGLLLKNNGLIPSLYYIGECSGYRFAISQFISGIPLREMLLNIPSPPIEKVMKEVGQALAHISTHSFSKSGFLDSYLNPIENFPGDEATFGMTCLKNDKVFHALSEVVRNKIAYYFTHKAAYFPSIEERQLVHGDFDPANILVDKVKGQWQITGILDWEFSFSGSPLWDMANLLRYAHHMPSIFKKAFLCGLTENGFKLPENWQITIYLLNLISLLECLTRIDGEVKPNQYKDIKALIDYILEELNKTIE